MDENGMEPADPETWIKQVAVYFHDAGWLVGVGFLLGLKYIFWGWISKIWSSLSRLIYKAISGRHIPTDEFDDDIPETGREKRIREEREKDQDEFRNFMDELNRRALAEIARLELRLRIVEQERDSKDKELYELRQRCEHCEAEHAEFRHMIRNARATADGLIDKYNALRPAEPLAPIVWKELR